MLKEMGEVGFAQFASGWGRDRRNTKPHALSHRTKNRAEAHQRWAAISSARRW